jgi:hypothetical protein
VKNGEFSEKLRDRIYSADDIKLKNFNVPNESKLEHSTTAIKLAKPQEVKKQ